MQIRNLLFVHTNPEPASQNKADPDTQNCLPVPIYKRHSVSILHLKTLWGTDLDQDT
jgi:hypothetical protein